MRTVYLGLFSRIFNWVFNAILSPVVNFVGDLIGTVLGWVYETVLIPVLTRVLSIVANIMIEMFKLWWCNTLYEILVALLKAVDAVTSGFDVFIGISDVTYEVDGVTANGPLLEALLSNKAINGAVWGVTAVGMTLALIFTIFATMKSTIDMDFENKKPVGAVLKSFLKTMIQFLCVPVIMAVIIKLSGLVLKAIDTLLSGGSSRTIGGTIFYTITMDAQKIDLFGMKETELVNPIFSETNHLKFLTGEFDYANIGDITATGFWIGQIDYVLGYICGLMMLIMLVSSIIVFIKRLFEVILLYVVSPLFISATPLDEGERFGRWREMFIGKLIVGYGTVIALRLYLIIVPEIVGNTRIRLTDASGGSDALLRGLLMVGGCWAIKKVGPMLTSLISSQAGMSETDDMRAGGQMISAHIIAPMKQMANGALREATRPLQKKFDNKLSNLMSGKKKSTSNHPLSSKRTSRPGIGAGSGQKPSNSINKTSNIQNKASLNTKTTNNYSGGSSTTNSYKGGNSGSSNTSYNSPYSSGSSLVSVSTGTSHSGSSSGSNSYQSSSSHTSSYTNESSGSSAGSFTAPTIHTEVSSRSVVHSSSDTKDKYSDSSNKSNITVNTKGMKSDK